MHSSQHSECVLQQLKPGPGMNPIPGRTVRETFLCEMCRWSRTDPFWEVVQGDIVPPATLKKNGKQGQVRGREDSVKLAAVCSCCILHVHAARIDRFC